MSEIKKQWYVIRAVGGKENKVKEYIESEIRHNHLEDYISQILIPTEKVYTIRNGKKISKEKVSYPSIPISSLFSSRFASMSTVPVKKFVKLAPATGSLKNRTTFSL